MVEYGHADGMAGQGAVVIDPGGAFAPGIIVAQAFAVDDFALGDIALETQGRGQADRHGTFLGVAECEWSLGGVDRDVEIQDAGAVALVYGRPADVARLASELGLELVTAAIGIASSEHVAKNYEFTRALIHA